jgi:hypothetical protein
MSPLPWLQEKTLCALEGAARLVDLANEKENIARSANALFEPSIGDSHAEACAACRFEKPGFIEAIESLPVAPLAPR